MVPNENQTTVLQAMRGNSNQSAKVVPLNIFKDLYRIMARQPRWEKARRIQNCQELCNPKMIQTCAKVTYLQSDSKG